MSFLNSHSPGGTNRYSAKKMAKPVNFYCHAPNAKMVSVIGDFNKWNRYVHEMTRQPDGTWFAQIPLHHGHHLYQFMVDGKPQLDSRATGTAPNEKNQPSSVVAVS